MDGGDKKTEWNQIIADYDKCYEGGGWREQLVKVRHDFRRTGQGNLSGSDI